MAINGGNSFNRIENKYIITLDQFDLLIKELGDHVVFDSFAAKNGGHYQVNSIYFDNDYRDVATRNLARPRFKEKLRLRSYGGEKPIYFLEFKDKVMKNVYKRRIYLSDEEYRAYVFEGKFPEPNGDWKHDRFLVELKVFYERYRNSIKPSTLMQYERMAYMNKPGDPYLRITCDKNLQYRREDFEINKLGGNDLVPPNMGILEVKIVGAMPLFLADALNKVGLRRYRFSKFGTSYLKEAKEKREEKQ